MIEQCTDIQNIDTDNKSRQKYRDMQRDNWRGEGGHRGRFTDADRDKQACRKTWVER